MLRVLLMIFLFSTTSIARANWTEFSVTYLCDSTAKTFTLAPDSFSEGRQIASAPSPKFLPLPQGADRTIECQIGKSKVRLSYSAYPPSEQGMCRGIGMTLIRGLDVNKRRIITATEINSGCFYEPTLVSVNIKDDAGQLVLETCEVSLYWENGFDNKLCRRHFLELDLKQPE